MLGANTVTFKRRTVLKGMLAAGASAATLKMPAVRAASRWSRASPRC
jgi:hypothetical protein